MMKIKSNSIMVEQPLAAELKDHLAKVIEKQEEQMRQKLQRQLEKEARIGSLQKDFVEWAGRKESKIRQKIQKSTQNKEDHLTKIVKKCKDHDKFLSQKFKNFQSRRKAEVKVAWKKAEQFNHSIEDYHMSRQLPLERSSHPHKTEQNLAESKYYGKRAISYERTNPQEYLSTEYNNSKFQSKVNNNNSKEYWGELNQSIKQFKFTEVVPRVDDDRDHINKIQMGNKLKETLARFKQQVEDHENEKIQQLAERLEKIEKTRIKKIEMQKKKKSVQDDAYETENAGRGIKKQKPDRSQRIHSESVMRERRVHDWSESTRQRREEFDQAKLQSGTEYLQHNKLKYMKTTLSKKIALSAIEKKLYFQRLTH